MKFEIITTLGARHEVELVVVPRIGDFIEGCEVFKVNYLVDSNFVAEVYVRSVTAT